MAGSGEACAWVLNFDAERELERPRGYQPRRADVQRMAALRRHVASGGPGSLVMDGDMCVDLGRALAAGRLGVAWCPTPSALRQLQEVGARIAAQPSLATLQLVNDRRFSAGLGQCLAGARYHDNVGSALRALDAADPGSWWLAKRAFGFSGKGSRRLCAQRLQPADRSWLEASLHDYGVQLEPLVERLLDGAIHGYVNAAGRVWLGRPVVQQCDARGQWQSTRLANPGEWSRAEEQALLAEVEHVGAALHGVGYFGPYGVDAFRYRRAGTSQLCVRCEINARYTMGWAVGMAERPDREGVDAA